MLRYLTGSEELLGFKGHGVVRVISLQDVQQPEVVDDNVLVQNHDGVLLPSRVGIDGRFTQVFCSVSHSEYGTVDYFEVWPFGFDVFNDAQELKFNRYVLKERSWTMRKLKTYKVLLSTINSAGSFLLNRLFWHIP